MVLDGMLLEVASGVPWLTYTESLGRISFRAKPPKDSAFVCTFCHSVFHDEFKDVETATRTRQAFRDPSRTSVVSVVV